MSEYDVRDDWASTDWLLTHFWSKSRACIRYMAQLPVRTGDSVLDVGCGPGVYTAYMADLVGPTGTVLGIDRLPASVAHANTLLSQRGCTHASAAVAEFSDVTERIQDYDVVLFMNSLGYFEEPLQVVRDVAERLRLGARIIVKDYDLESIFLTPVNRPHLCSLMEGAWNGNVSTSNPLAFNNFFGRRIPFLSGTFPFSSADLLTWTHVMVHPFTEQQRRYISGNILSLVDQARGHCADDALSYFERDLVPLNGTFFATEQAMFTENEYVCVLTK